MNRWNIPAWLEDEVRARDKTCIYCHIEMTNTPSISRKTLATWEHIINNASIITRENIALCCSACNSSKGTKPLRDWLGSPYCQKKGITENSIAPVAKAALNQNS